MTRVVTPPPGMLASRWPQLQAAQQRGSWVDLKPTRGGRDAFMLISLGERSSFDAAARRMCRQGKEIWPLEGWASVR